MKVLQCQILILNHHLNKTQCIVRCTQAKVPTDVILINDLAVVEMERRKEN